MSPLSLYHHLLGAALPLFRFLQHFLLVPFLLAHPAPAMEGQKNDASPGADRAAAAGREGEEEERGGVGAEEEGEDEAEELDVVGEDEDEDEDEEDEDEHGIDYLPESVQRSRSSRTPFTSLSQVDADLALARTLQEQERAYLMLRMGGGGGSDFVGSESGSEYELHYEDDEGEDDHSAGHGSAAESDYDEDAFDAQDLAVGVDPSAFDNDEAYARALQDAEEREVAVRLMALAGINDWVAEDAREHGGNSQDTWLEVDPDELSYEELIALGEAVGTESRGLAADTIASLPSVSYKKPLCRCVICRLDYEDGDSLIVLSCKHMYHPDCINQWLQINKVCPICSAEVSTSENAQG
ncbi:hypothetical protein Taro_040973 [Colocasia esculenta]|uniref:RING-type domain-containing protein n=1 Tax=Colocasia esculenta TaxID=4460 RepID=A0A843WD63_COLES|nr:hypothetical protein [Colocasia esculenta]